MFLPHLHRSELIPLHYSAIATYLCVATRNQVVGISPQAATSTLRGVDHLLKQFHVETSVLVTAEKD